MGIPPDDEQQVFAWTNVILGAGDPEYGGVARGPDDRGAEHVRLRPGARRGPPGHTRRDDLTSAMMNAEVDGERLTPARSSARSSSSSPSPATRRPATPSATACALLTEHPDQRQIWFDDFAGVTKTAVDEIVRYATPVIHFRRTATEDTEPSARPSSRPATRSCSGTTRPTATSGCSTDPFRVRRAPPAATAAGRLRRRRSALLPRRQPRPAGDHRDVRRDPHPPARTCASPASRPTCRASSSTASSGSPAPGASAPSAASGRLGLEPGPGAVRQFAVGQRPGGDAPPGLGLR